jgi:DNA polymerase III epsilon subunit-like protein
MCYAVVDVEGNGQQPPDLVEVAVVPVAAGIIGAPGRWLVKPPRSVSRIAARIHGLTNEALAAAPAFADIESEVREALDAAGPEWAVRRGQVRRERLSGDLAERWPAAVR